MTLEEIVTATLAEFDASREQVERWANDRHRRIVAEARWRMVQRPIATTSTGQAVYPVDVGMVDLDSLRVGGTIFGRVGPEQMWALSDATSGARVTGNGCVFAPAFDANGGHAIELFPVPATSGTAIVGLMAFVPDTMGSSDSPIIPVDFHGYLLDGVFADAYIELDGRQDLAQVHEARFADGVVKLRKRKVSRIGSRATRMAVAGYDF